MSSLDQFLAHQVAQRGLPQDLAVTVLALAAAGQKLSRLIARGNLSSDPAACIKADNGAGDAQKALDLLAHDIVVDAMRTAPVAWLASEESDQCIKLVEGGPYSVAIDPVDGSSNIETNLTIGTIFSILPTVKGLPSSTFLQPGTRQAAAGFIAYGPQCTMYLTFGHGTDVFVLDPDAAGFVLAGRGVRVADETTEFAINASNARHWRPEVRSYIADCVLGREGLLGKDFNMRWIASMVADAQRILTRGGVYLYPHDNRKGYENGRLRLLYEANPIGFLIEQAGGSAIDGFTRILDIAPDHIHQRTPLIFGSSAEVKRVGRYIQGLEGSPENHSLFSERGLFRT